MIVTSQTCFLNDLTQLYPKEVLLKADYYIVDLTGPGGIPKDTPIQAENRMLVGEETRWRYNESGELVEDLDGISGNGIRTGSPTRICERASIYNVHYCKGAMNPDSMAIPGRIGPEIQARSLEERYYYDLRSEDSSVEIYKDLFKEKPTGNGLQILIWSSDTACTHYGWVLNEYLSGCFGADIIFIDAIYRTRISKHAKKQYVGNKQMGLQYVQWVRDQMLLRGFKDDTTKAGTRETVENIRNRLNMQNWASLIHTYNLLWPNDPLPQGNYSEEQLREIITHKLLQERGPSPYDALDNMCSMNAGMAFFQLANDYDKEI